MNYTKPKRIRLPDGTYIKQVPTACGVLASIIKTPQTMWPKPMKYMNTKRQYWGSSIWTPTYYGLREWILGSTGSRWQHIKFAITEWYKGL